MAKQILFPQSDNVVSFEDCKRKGLPTASPLSEARCLDELIIQASAKFRFLRTNHFTELVDGSSVQRSGSVRR